MTDDSDVLVVSVPEAGRLLSCSRATAYSWANQGLIPTLRIGRKLIVPKAALLKMLEQVGNKPESD